MIVLTWKAVNIKLIVSFLGNKIIKIQYNNANFIANSTYDLQTTQHSFWTKIFYSNNFSIKLYIIFN